MRAPNSGLALPSCRNAPYPPAWSFSARPQWYMNVRSTKPPHSTDRALNRLAHVRGLRRLADRVGVGGARRPAELADPERVRGAGGGREVACDERAVVAPALLGDGVVRASLLRVEVDRIRVDLCPEERRIGLQQEPEPVERLGGVGAHLEDVGRCEHLDRGIGGMDRCGSRADESGVSGGVRLGPPEARMPRLIPDLECLQWARGQAGFARQKVPPAHSARRDAGKAA